MKKVWVEISKSALKHNVRVIRRHLLKGVRLWAVVKSNAYGHGIHAFSAVANTAGVDGFCVDSVIEGLTLRREKIKKQILVLGPTLPNLYKQARAAKIAITISNWDSLRSLAKHARRPAIHLKLDTGMYRQGFYASQLPEVMAFLKEQHIALEGVYSHFADSSESASASFTKKQFAIFTQAISYIRESGFPAVHAHIANTAAALLDTKYQLDGVRIGNGLYGIYPSRGYENRMCARLNLKPVLSWHALVSEVKKVPPGGAIGYGRTRVTKAGMSIALIPIGYWHGLPWTLSNNGEVIISGKRVPIIGRVSMDMIAVDVTHVSCSVGSKATFIGTQQGVSIAAREVAEWVHTRPQEILTRINPLIERVIV